MRARQEYIHESFQHIESTDQALDLLSKLHALLQRESLVPYLNAKYLNVFTNFSHDLDAVSNMYETLKENPPMARDAPPVAGMSLIRSRKISAPEAFVSPSLSRQSPPMPFSLSYLPFTRAVLALGNPAEIITIIDT
jgi:hypothetical protein